MTIKLLRIRSGDSGQDNFHPQKFDVLGARVLGTGVSGGIVYDKERGGSDVAHGKLKDIRK